MTLTYFNQEKIRVQSNSLWLVMMLGYIAYNKKINVGNLIAAFNLLSSNSGLCWICQQFSILSK